MAKRIVIALGGNALGKNLEEQMQAVKTTASAIADLIEAGHEVVIAHGNGLLHHLENLLLFRRLETDSHIAVENNLFEAVINLLFQNA